MLRETHSKQHGNQGLNYFECQLVEKVELGLHTQINSYESALIETAIGIKRSNALSL